MVFLLPKITKLKMSKKEFNIDGYVKKVKPPRFNSKTGCFIINTKINDKWQYVWRKRERDALDVYQQLLDVAKEQDINIDRKQTRLTTEMLRECENVVDRLNRKYSQEVVTQNNLLTEAVEYFIKNKPTIVTPTLPQACEIFLNHRKSFVSEITYRDYKYSLNKLCLVYGDRRVGDISVMDMREFFKLYVNPNVQKHLINLKAFFEFCCGKDNELTDDGKGWLPSNPIRWKQKGRHYKDPSVFNFEQVVELLMLTHSVRTRMRKYSRKESNYSRVPSESISYYIFRLFSCMRKEEFVRMVTLGGEDITTNRYIDLEGRKLILTPDVYKKRGSMTGATKGRVYDDLPEVFMMWLKWMIENKVRLSYPKGRHVEHEINTLCKRDGIDRHNILRHTGITFHLLNFKQTVRTTKIAGTSLAIIEQHYLNMNIPTIDAEKFYKLTPTRAEEMGILI